MRQSPWCRSRLPCGGEFCAGFLMPERISDGVSTWARSSNSRPPNLRSWPSRSVPVSRGQAGSRAYRLGELRPPSRTTSILACSAAPSPSCAPSSFSPSEAARRRDGDAPASASHLCRFGADQVAVLERLHAELHAAPDRGIGIDMRRHIGVGVGRFPRPWPGFRRPSTAARRSDRSATTRRHWP